ncbi:MAG: hypothetical protein QHJ82_01995, partial [Verrucomicrobiota bacterium]|nr:hypothetical protein [Verrucomicrobiota bacterium]
VPRQTTGRSIERKAQRPTFNSAALIDGRRCRVSARQALGPLMRGVCQAGLRNTCCDSVAGKSTLIKPPSRRARNGAPYLYAGVHEQTKCLALYLRLPKGPTVVTLLLTARDADMARKSV